MNVTSISNILHYILLVFVGILIVSCSTTRRTANKPPEYKQDEDVLFDNISYRISDICWTQEAGPRYLKKQANASFLIINLTLTNRAQKPIDRVFSPIFRLEDSSGNEYESSGQIFILEGLESKMMTQPLNPNVGVQGLIVFDVPRHNKYKLRILSPFYARQAFGRSIRVAGLFFYIVLDPRRVVDDFEI